MIKLDVGKELREAVAEFHFPDMIPDHFQYFAREKRQWVNHLTQAPMKVFPCAWNHSYMHAGLRLPFFIEVMPGSMFDPAVEAARMATPQRKNGTYVGRSFGLSISDTAEPAKRAQQERKAVDVD